MKRRPHWTETAALWLLKEARRMYDLEDGEHLAVIELDASDCWLKWPKGRAFNAFDAEEYGIDLADVRRIPSGRHPGSQWHDWLNVTALVVGVTIERLEETE